jgi:hypothetical protein
MLSIASVEDRIDGISVKESDEFVKVPKLPEQRKPICSDIKTTKGQHTDMNQTKNIKRNCACKQGPFCHICGFMACCSCKHPNHSSEKCNEIFFKQSFYRENSWILALTQARTDGQCQLEHC